MRLMEFLQGKWLGHPAHPAIVHIPLGLWGGAAFLDVLAACGVQNSTLARLAFYAVLFGLLGTLIVIPTGVADWASIKKEKPAWKLGFYHMVLNLLATVVWAVNFGLRYRSLDDVRPITTPVVLLSVLGAILLIVSGYLGSLLAFDHGISVARFSKKKWRQIAQKGGANVPKEE
jgi:uncharacterized membrane protein